VSENLKFIPIIQAVSIYLNIPIENIIAFYDNLGTVLPQRNCTCTSARFADVAIFAVFLLHYFFSELLVNLFVRRMKRNAYLCKASILKSVDFQQNEKD